MPWKVDRLRILLGTMALIALAPGISEAQPVPKARADMVDLQGRAVGTVTFEQTSHGILVVADLEGLPPGWHGFHIHETAACDPPFASAGGHFNPSGEAHGFRSGGLHAGDLPNLFVGADGKARAEMINDRVALATERPTDIGFLNRAISAVQGAAGLEAYNLLTGRGTAVIVHARPDDYRSNPAGDSGDRIACGIIKLP